MKKKILSGVFLAALLLVSMTVIPTSAITPVTSISVIFDESGTTSLSWTENGHTIGDTFTVSIVANGAVDLWAWAVALKWNSSLLNCTTAAWGNFLTLSGGGLRTTTNAYDTIDNVAGEMYPPVGETSTVNNVTASSVTLMTATFKTLAFPYPNTTIVDFGTNVVWGGDTGVEIYPPAFTMYNGTFSFSPIANVGPTAVIEIDEPTPYYAPAYLTLNGTKSSDPDGTVDAWNWTIKNSTDDVIYTSTSSVFNYNFTDPDDYTATLIVTDNGKLPYYLPLSSDPVVKSISVYAVLESYIDAYTEGSAFGSGPNAYGSAFEPGELVTISADLMYAGVPVNNTLVSFQLKDVTGDDVTYRTAITVGGKATINVRLPLMGTAHLTGEGDFGLFTCIATADVFEEPFNDTVTLNVGWMVDTTEVTATAASRGGTTTVTVNTVNYALEDQLVYLTVTIYDSVDVAIGVMSQSFTIGKASADGLGVIPGTDTRDFIVGIPSDAWPGPATVYVNCYDKSPFAGGDAWCSEIETSLTIS